MKESHDKIKYIAKIVLIIAAIIFTLHLLLFNYTIFIILPFLKAIYIVTEMLLIGYFILFKFANHEQTILEYIGVGLIFTSFFFYCFSFVKVLNFISFFIYFIISIIIFYLLLKDKKFKDNLINISVKFLKRNPLEYLILVFPFIYASLPPTFYDSLVYHLGIPNLYIQNGGFFKTPFMVYANTSVYYELSLIPSVFTSNLTPRLFHFILSAIFLLCFVDYFEEKFKLRKKYYFLMVLFSLPVTMFLITAVKNDIIAALFIFIGIKAYYKNNKILSAVFFGFSIGVKYFSVLPIMIFIFIEIIKSKKIEVKKHALIFFIIFLLLIPLFIKNFVYTGNPFFPFFSRYFKVENWDNSRMEIMKKDVGQIFHNIKDFMSSPYNISFKNYGSVGRIGPVFLIFLPFLALYGTKHPDILMFSFLTIFIGGWFTGSIRFMYIGVIIAVPFVIKALEKLNNRLMKTVFLIVVGINFINSFAILERIYDSSSVYSGKDSIYQYKIKHFPAYRMYYFINNKIKKGNKILIVGEARNFYLKRKYSVSSAIDYSILKPYIDKSKTSIDFMKLIKEDGYDFMFMNVYEFTRFQKEYKRLNKSEIKKLYYFLSKIKPVFHKNGMLLYKIK
jgi:hypothetical protein